MQKCIFALTSQLVNNMRTDDPAAMNMLCHIEDPECILAGT